MLTKSDPLIYELINDPRFTILEGGDVFKQTKNVGVKKKPVHVGGCGYLKISFKGRNIMVHRLLYAKFLGQLDSNLVILHKDGNKLNNALSNLAQVTRSENRRHCFRVLGHKNPKPGKKITQEIADAIRKEDFTTQNYRQIGQKYGLSKTNIGYIVKNKIWRII